MLKRDDGDAPLAICSVNNLTFYNGAMATEQRYVYLSIREIAPLFNKGRSRAYQMAAEGLFDQVGYRVVRICNGKKKGRIWIGIPDNGRFDYSLTRLGQPQQKGGP